MSVAQLKARQKMIEKGIQTKNEELKRAKENKKKMQRAITAARQKEGKVKGKGDKTKGKGGKTKSKGDAALDAAKAVKKATKSKDPTVAALAKNELVPACRNAVHKMLKACKD